MKKVTYKKYIIPQFTPDIGTNGTINAPMLSSMLRNNSICVSFLKQSRLYFNTLLSKLSIELFLSF